MPPFTCNRCGKCCASLGRHIHILRVVPHQGVYGRDEVSGEIFFARPAAPDWGIWDGPEDRCPFLSREEDGRARCTIYPFRPRTCREFRCAMAVILAPDEREAGRVVGRRSLSTTDEGLKVAWEREVPALAAMDDHHFLLELGKALSHHGYRVEPFT